MPKFKKGHVTTKPTNIKDRNTREFVIPQPAHLHKLADIKKAKRPKKLPIFGGRK